MADQVKKHRRIYPVWDDFWWYRATQEDVLAEMRAAILRPAQNNQQQDDKDQQHAPA